MNGLRKRLVPGVASACIGTLGLGLATIGLAQERPRQYTIAADASADPAHKQEAEYLKEMARSLRGHGFILGTNLRIEAIAKGDVEREAAAMLALKPDLIHVRNTMAAKAVARLTSTIPIVFRVGSDPVASGLVASYARPGRNLTGVVAMGEGTMAKRFELARELLPAGRRLAFLSNMSYQRSAEFGVDQLLRGWAVDSRWELSVVDVSEFGADCDRARQVLSINRPDLVMLEPPFDVCVDEFMQLESALRIPTISAWFDGVLQFAADESENLRHAMDIAARILKGVRPEVIPVARTQRFVLTVDLGRARALGIAVPASILLRADKVVDDGASRPGK